MTKILLGDQGVFAIGGVTFITRGGGEFMVERKFKHIDADNQRGPVKGNQRIIEEVAKLTVNALEIVPADIIKAYPGMNADATTDATKTKVTGTLAVADADYVSVTWTGKTQDGKAVVITLDNAINLENVDWKIVDKDETVPKLTFTAHYDPTALTTPPYDITYTN